LLVVVQTQLNQQKVLHILLHSFQDHNITVYGKWDNPLFKASEIGEMLGLQNIRKTIRDMNEEFKVFEAGTTSTGLQEQYFLTEDGLYELLFISTTFKKSGIKKRLFTRKYFHLF
jgi:prophage antirepressor-like protein